METEAPPLVFGYLKHAPAEDVARRKTLIASLVTANRQELDEIFVEPHSDGRTKFNQLLGALKLHQGSGRKIVVAITSRQDLGTTRYEQKWATNAINNHDAQLEIARFLASQP